MLLIPAGAVLACLIAIQLIPVPHNNPPVLTQIQWDSPQTEALARRACMDCHSNETVWPWYATVAPGSWLISFDVIRGRSHWNLSTIGASRDQLQAQNSQLPSFLQSFLRFSGREGRREFGEGGNRQGGNFPPEGSFDPARGADRLTGEISRQVDSGQMPPANYIILHPDASLTPDEKQQLIDGLVKSIQQTLAQIEATGPPNPTSTPTP